MIRHRQQHYFRLSGSGAIQQIMGGTTMKTLNVLTIIVILSFSLLGCDSDSDSPNNLADVTPEEQAEIVAAALAADTGGIGKDIENLADPSSNMATSKAVSLTISASMDFYDADDNPQDYYDPETTDRVDYEGIIAGELTSQNRFFQELIIDNYTHLMATDLLSRTATIDGSHSNHSSYSRVPQDRAGAEIHYSLNCDLSAVNVAVDMDAADTFPESGTIEGTVEGSYSRVTDLSSDTRALYFHFTAHYLGDNTARIELSNGDVFIVQLETGEVEEAVVE